MKYVKPTNDLAFKKVLGSSENVHILAGLYKDFYFIEPKELSIENPYSIKAYREFLRGSESFRLRQTLSDISATMKWADYRSELQVRKDKYYDKRSLYYPLDKFISRYKFVEGESSGYARLCPIYSLNILGYNHFDDDDALRIFKLYDPVRNKAMEMDFINLGHFELLKPNIETDNQRDWQNYFLQRPLSPNAPDYIQEALHIIEQSNMKEEELEVITQMDYLQSVLDGQFEQVRDEGFDEGFGEGFGEGLDEGIGLGKKEGIVEIVTNLLKINAPMDIIIAASGYTAEEIENLR